MLIPGWSNSANPISIGSGSAQVRWILASHVKRFSLRQAEEILSIGFSTKKTEEMNMSKLDFDALKHHALGFLPEPKEKPKIVTVLVSKSTGSFGSGGLFSFSIEHKRNPEFQRPPKLRSA